MACHMDFSSFEKLLSTTFQAKRDRVVFNSILLKGLTIGTVVATDWVDSFSKLSLKNRH